MANAPNAENEAPTILIVDDDADDNALLGIAFEKACVAHTRKYVINGAEAIKYLTGSPPYDDRQQFPLPILIILDLKLPLKDGFEVLRWLETSDQKKLPVIVLTGSTHKTDQTNAFALGAAEFHTKPSEFNETIVLVKGICDRWLGKNTTDG